jgi:hypothetical protein
MQKESGKKTREAIPQIDQSSLACEAKAKNGEKWNLKFSSWNVNGVRAWVEVSLYNCSLCSQY